MKFATATAIFAASVAAQETVYSTKLITVSKCLDDVVDCPYESKTAHVTQAVIPHTTSTIYETLTHTITSCLPDVTDCPAHSTVIKTEVVAVDTTVCPVTETGVPTPHWGNSTVAATPTGGNTGPAKPTGPANTGAPACTPSNSVVAVTKSYTTVLTSVEYSTVAVPCPTQAPVCPGGENCPPTGPAQPTGAPVPGNNGTVTPPVTGAAGSLMGSAVFAAAAGIAAFILA